MVKTLELLQLKYFLRVAEMGHLTRAAESLYISQPALSRSIRRLEKELGVPVFEKRGRGLVLTTYGTHLYARVQLIFSELEQDSQERADILGCTAAPIRVGTTISGITLPVLERYHEAHPQVKLLHDYLENNQALLHAVLSDTIDLGFCDLVRFPAEICHKTIWKDQLYVLVPKTHQLASSQNLSLTDLQFDTLILSTSESVLWDTMKEFCGAFPSCVHAATMQEALRLCLLGIGIPLTTGFYLNIQMSESLHSGKSLLDFAIPIAVAGYSWNISLIWKQKGYYHQQFQSFLDDTVSYYQEQSGQHILETIVRKEP